MTYSVLNIDALRGLKLLPDDSVDCIVTSPPYWGLRDYGCDGQIGLEQYFSEYLEHLIEIFDECRRVLKGSGTMWVNMGDAYFTGAGAARKPGGGSQGKEFKGPETQPNRMPNSVKLPRKSLIGQPWRLTFALQDAGWTLRSDIIWHKPSPMPESVKDRPTRAHEYLFLFTKSPIYYYDHAAIAEPCIHNSGPGWRKKTQPGTRNARTVWSMASSPFPEAHFATFPRELPRRCILAGCPEGGVVLDPFAGSGTTLEVALALHRNSIGIELNPEYCKMIERRLAKAMRTMDLTPSFRFEDLEAQ